VSYVGDSRATGAQATNLGGHLASLYEAAPTPNGAVGSGAHTAQDEGPTVVPASSEKRKANVKRIRDGAAAANRNDKKVKAADKTAMMKVVTEYFSFNLEQAKRGAQNVPAEQPRANTLDETDNRVAEPPRNYSGDEHERIRKCNREPQP
jgi:hypothetical protein